MSPEHKEQVDVATPSGLACELLEISTESDLGFEHLKTFDRDSDLGLISTESDLSYKLLEISTVSEFGFEILDISTGSHPGKSLSGARL